MLEPYDTSRKKRRMAPGEFRAAERNKSWKFQLIKAIEDALRYSTDRESFIRNMKYEGYEVHWDSTHKYILFVTPDGNKCRDRSLHDETYLKENLEKLFEFRQRTGFVPQTPEPDIGWLGEMEQYQSVVQKAVAMCKNLEDMVNVPLPSAPQTWTDSKQRQREALKKLAQGHKLQSEHTQGQGYEQHI